MPDHLHFLSTPKVDGVSVLTLVDQFKGKSTNESWKLGHRGKLWQPRYFDHIVRTEENLRDISEYILNNPVRKGLTLSAATWPWAGHLNPLPLE
jgi:REP element-mobilizing transposase RayT